MKGEVFTRLQGLRCRVHTSGFKGSGVHSSGFEVCNSGFRVQGSGLRVWGSGFGVCNSEFRIQGSGFRVQGSGFGVWGLGLGFGVQGLGFRIQGSGSGIRGPRSMVYFFRRRVLGSPEPAPSSVNPKSDAGVLPPAYNTLVAHATAAAMHNS